MKSKPASPSKTVVSGFQGLWLCTRFPDPVVPDLRTILLFLQKGTQRYHLLIQQSGTYTEGDPTTGSTFPGWYTHELYDGKIRAKNITWGGRQFYMKWRRDDEGRLILVFPKDPGFDMETRAVFVPATLDECWKAGFDPNVVRQALEWTVEDGAQFQMEASFPVFSDHEIGP